MQKCPACQTPLSKPPEDEWAECGCGWSEVAPHWCPECEKFRHSLDFNEKHGVCDTCHKKSILKKEVFEVVYTRDIRFYKDIQRVALVVLFFVVAVLIMFKFYGVK